MKRKYLPLAGAAAVLLVAALFRFPARVESRAAARVPVLRPAAVALARRAPVSRTLVLSGQFKPFQFVDVHAKVAGYIRRIYVDVGDKVKRGAILAELEVPELNAQLMAAYATIRRDQDSVRRSQDDLARSRATHQAKHLAYSRLKKASEQHTGLIAQQELDHAFATDQAAEAAIQESGAALSEAQNELAIAQAEQKRLQALADYTRIVAPFDGVITKRYADTGTLVQAGTASNTQALPVVTIAEYKRLRLVLPVPEYAVPEVHLGGLVDVNVLALHRHFAGTVARFADALDMQTRTMHTEVDVANPSGALLDGMYAEVSLVLQQHKHALTVPLQAVTRRGNQASVLMLDGDDRIQEHPVQLGLEGSTRVEVLSGLNLNDRIVVGRAGDFHPGEKIHPMPFKEATNAEEF